MAHGRNDGLKEQYKLKVPGKGENAIVTKFYDIYGNEWNLDFLDTKIKGIGANSS